MNGTGRITYTNGEIYTGELKDGKLHGQGKFSMKNGTVLYGTWDKGKYIEFCTSELLIL